MRHAVSADAPFFEGLADAVVITTGRIAAKQVVVTIATDAVLGNAAVAVVSAVAVARHRGRRRGSGRIAGTQERDRLGDRLVEASQCVTRCRAAVAGRVADTRPRRTGLKVNRNAQDEQAVGGDRIQTRTQRLAAVALRGNYVLGSGEETDYQRDGEKRQTSGQV